MSVLVVCSRARPAVKEPSDPAGLREQVVVLFDEWGRLSEEQPANQMHDKFVLKLQTAGFLKVTPITCHCNVCHSGVPSGGMLAPGNMEHESSTVNGTKSAYAYACAHLCP